MKTKLFFTLTLLCCALFIGCNKDSVAPAKGFYSFASDRCTFGVLDPEEWFEVPITASATHPESRNIGIEVVAAESSAIEGMHYTLESHTVKLAADKAHTAVRLKCNPDAYELGETLTLTLRLAANDKFLDEGSNEVCTVELIKCCPFDRNLFTGYCKVTSTFLMQYTTSESRLVRSVADEANPDGIIIKDMFYDGYDVALTLRSDNRLNPLVDMPATVIGSTGDAFGTIYGDGKLMMKIVDDERYVSYYGTCERFVFNYGHIYVDGVGDVGAYLNIVEWLTDDEAERIMREGL